MPAGPDQTHVGLTEEELLKAFVARRDAGDGDAARPAWEQLIEASFDRVRGMVDARARRFGLSPDEREEALQQALVRLWRKMIGTFRGTTMGEYVNAMKRLVDFACIDVQRDAARRTEHEAALEDDAAKPEGDHRAEERRDAADFVAWAVPRLKNERRRRVVELTLADRPAEEIAAELDVTMDNLYALRSRGLKDLGKLRDEWFET